MSKLRRIQQKASELAGRAYEEYMPSRGKRITEDVGRRGGKMREGIKARAPRGKERVKRMLVRGIDIANPLSPPRKKEKGRRRK